MARGAIKWFNPVKGYGFITRDAGGDVFVHSNGLGRSEDRRLFPGDCVVFDEVDGEKGPKAVNVRRLDRVADGAQPADQEDGD